MSQDTTARQLTPTTSQHSVELCDVRLDLQLSRETLSRMSEVDHRTTRAFTTATRFAFR
ncbi:hypothetical protein [Sphingopyxis bauzanensis]|nr:hypothetical protein [Sphingopyxis bauzanensis]